MIRKIIGVILALWVLAVGAAALFLLVYFERKPPREVKPPRVRVVKYRTLKFENVPARITGYGTVRVRDKVQIAPEVTGKVTARAVLIEPKIKRRVKEDVLRGEMPHRTVGAKNAAAKVYE